MERFTWAAFNHNIIKITSDPLGKQFGKFSASVGIIGRTELKTRSRNGIILRDAFRVLQVSFPEVCRYPINNFSYHLRVSKNPSNYGSQFQNTFNDNLTEDAAATCRKFQQSKQKQKLDRS